MAHRYGECLSCLDHTLSSLLSHIEQSVGAPNTCFCTHKYRLYRRSKVDLCQISYPHGNILYQPHSQSAQHVFGRYLRAGALCRNLFHNQIYLNRKLIEDKRISFSDIISRSKEFLVQVSGVRAVQESPYNPSISGDLIIEVSPGWQLLNEDNHESYTSRAAFIPFPIIFYGSGIKPQRINTPCYGRPNCAYHCQSHTNTGTECLQSCTVAITACRKQKGGLCRYIRGISLSYYISD